MTSASNAQADRMCPGRHLAQRGLLAPPKESDDASIGTLIHAAMAGEEVQLNRSQRKTLDRGRGLEVAVAQEWFRERGMELGKDDIWKRAHREQRLWLEHNGQRIHSAQLDSFWLTENFEHALIEDFKSLWGDVADAANNEQLRDAAALLWLHFGCKRVSVFINQPNVRWKVEEQKLVEYEEADLERAHKEMLARVLASNDIKSPRIPSLEACKFCRAAGTSRCPESQAVMLETASEAARKTFDWTAAKPKARGAWVTNLRSAAAAIKKELERAKAMLDAEPDSISGYHIAEGATTRTLENILEVGRILAEAFPETMTPEKLTGCCTLSLPKLEELFEELSGMTGKEARDGFEALFGELITKGRKAGSLAPKKEEKE